MHVLYLHQYFNTRAGITGTRSYEFSKRLLQQGHRVTMLTSGVGSPDGLDVPDGREFFETDIEGIHVVPLAAGFNAHAGTGMSGFTRMREFMRFARMAGRIGKKMERPDVVFATHTPLNIGLAGIDLGDHFKVPFVFEVRDLWPEALVNIGALKNPVAIWWLRRMALKIYPRAKHIIALSPGMKEGIVASGIRPDDVTIIPNGSDLDLFRPDLDGSRHRERLGLGDRFAAIYFGAMGFANGLEYAIEAARILRDRGNSRIVVVLHGGGGMRADLEQLATGYKLDNLVFSDPVEDKSAVADIVAGCDACMTIYRATKKEQTWSPNKMFDALAAGKPVLINVPGWLGDTIENNGCGYYVDPDRPEALADALETLAANRETCRQMGERSRRLAEREFARDLLADRFIKVLQDAVNSA